MGSRGASRARSIRVWVLLVLLTLLLRLPSLAHPHQVDDEGGYAVVAHELLAGETLYQTAIDRYPPLLFWTYAGIFAGVGEYNWYGFHAVAAAWILATMLGLYVIGRRLFSEPVGLAAALLYSVATARSGWENLALNGEVMMNLPIVWAIAIAFRPGRGDARMRWELAASGALLAAAFLLKQPAAIAAVPIGLYLLLPSYRSSRGLRPRDSLLHAGLLTTSYFAVLGLVALEMLRQGILADAWHWSFADHDVPHGPLDPIFWQRGLKEAAATTVVWLPLVLLCAVSLREARRRGARYWRGREAEFTALLLLLAFSSIGVCASGRFYSHYFFQLLPALTLLAAPVLSGIWRRERSDRFFLLRPVPMAVLVFGTGLASLIGNAVELWPRRTPSPLARYVSLHSEPDDKVFFWGQRSWFYSEARRRPASRFILSFPLTGYIFGSPLSDDPDHDTRDRIQPWAWETLQEEFSRTPPVLFIDTDPGTDAKKYPPTRYPYLKELLEAEYEVVQTAPEGVVYRRIATPEDVRGAPGSEDAPS